jgi:quinol-cytochrome oxidoreductase complex cytochrome b subunit
VKEKIKEKIELIKSFLQTFSTMLEMPGGLTQLINTLWMVGKEFVLNWLEERFRLRAPIEKILDKPVSGFERKWRHCFGGITLTLIGLQLVTGVFLSFYYSPSSEQAYESIKMITDEVDFGWLIRGIHHWSAYLIVVTMLIHLLKVFITGSYRHPREFTWVSGVLLLMIVFGFLATGYLLTWSQQGYWASRVAMGLAGEVPVVGWIILLFVQGGYVIKQAALTRFFVAHVFLLPVAIIVLLGVHFALIRRLGIQKPL